MQKVFPADDHSAVAIAGAAGPALQMVRVFQLQLEYYEKIEGKPLTLEGKANQLAEMLRGTFRRRCRVSPLSNFAGYDGNRDTGRLFQFDVTGGRYEEQDFATSGSGSLHAGTVIKLGFRSNLTTEEALRLAVKALWHAADEDSATGGLIQFAGFIPCLVSLRRMVFAN